MTDGRTNPAAVDNRAGPTGGPTCDASQCPQRRPADRHHHTKLSSPPPVQLYSRSTESADPRNGPTGPYRPQLLRENRESFIKPNL